jgi:phospholipid/cholesterol/gamma-HCH transport system substrate-binding protein
MYNNLNSTLKHANALLAEADAGRGALGLLTKDPAFAKKVNDTVTQLDTLLTNVNTGKGTIGKLAKDETLYTNMNTLLTSSTDLVQAVRKDPKKYLVIHLKIF